MTSRRDEFYAAYDKPDWGRLAPFLRKRNGRLTRTLTSEATRWLLDRWDDDDEARVADPAPPDGRNRKYVGGVDV